MAQLVEMTVHEALVEVKTNTKRINDIISSTVFCAANKKSAKNVNGYSVSEFDEISKANYQSINDLIKRTNAIKAALSLSNASTYVTIGNKKMSIAEALYLLTHGMDDKKLLLKTLRSQFNSAISKINLENGDKMDQKIESLLSVASINDKSKNNDINAISEVYRANNEFIMLDPIDIKTEIKKLEEEINEFESSIDSVLQVSNAINVIKFEY